MSAAPERIRSPIEPAGRPAGDRGRDLVVVAVARLAVALVALPVGIVLRPEAPPGAGRILALAVGVVLALSAGFLAAARTRRGIALQTYLQITADLVLVTWLATLTGGRGSQFVLFYALVAITGGLLGRLPGGLYAAAGACLGWVLLPALSGGAGADTGLESALPHPGLLVAFLLVTGVLSGVLGRRVRAAHDDLERTTRELHRVRVDNDVILRHLATGVLTVDAWGTVAYLNPAAEQVLGLRTLEVRGRPIEEAFPARLALLRDLVLDGLRGERSRNRVELTARSARGVELTLGVSTNLLRHEDVLTGVVAVFQDLTEVRAMERRARRNETLAEVGALAAGIAHEMRNGLNPISGSVEFLQRELKPEGESAVLMGLIVKECGRLNRFVTDLLNYARERDLALGALDLEEHLAELREGLQRDPRCGTNVRVVFEPPAVGVALRADREQLRQVWLNLANNALDAMADRGGVLTVRWRGEGDERVVVEFADQGVGIDPAALSRVGEPFFTTKQGGTGLGVAIAQRIVERHGGSLGFESDPGRGTVARVSLPATIEILASAA